MEGLPMLNEQSIVHTLAIVCRNIWRNEQAVLCYGYIIRSMVLPGTIQIGQQVPLILTGCSHSGSGH